MSVPTDPAMPPLSPNPSETLKGCLILLLGFIGLSAVMGWAGCLDEDPEVAKQQLIDEAKSKEIEEQKAAEELAARRANAARDSKRVQLFRTVLDTAGIDYVGTIACDDLALTIAVDNRWHSMPYQVRLQAAQDLWAAWAKLVSPLSVDSARITINDQRGNRVGGSRVLGGSLIWVDER